MFIARTLIDIKCLRASAPLARSISSPPKSGPRRPLASRAVLAAVVALAALLPSASRAQNLAASVLQFDVSGSYSYVRAGSANIGGAFNLNGGSAAVNCNFGDHFSAVADVGGYTFSDLPAGLSSNLYTYLVGPRYTVRKFSRFVPFAQVLLGGARVTASSGGLDAGENAFAFSIGAGLDMPLRHRLALRLFEADYLLPRFPNLNGNSAVENHARISAGIVLRLGH